MHTPGPWAIRPHDLMQRIKTREGHTVAIPAMNDGVPALTCLANARLIAAAPELLAALQMVAKIWSHDQTANIAPDSPVAIVRAAIAKATGD